MQTSPSGRPPVIRSVAIVGGGFSGTLQAINLLRHRGPRAILIERRPEIGRGVAYSAADPSLLLNVRAANMSALPDRPSHFTEWLERRGLPAEGFVPRVLYGEYLSELLDETRAGAPDALEIVRGDVVHADVTRDGIAIRLGDGREIRADALVLALGNLPPAPPDNLDPAALPGGSYEADPWSATIADGLKADDRVLIVGTGLTMVDAALLLTKKGFRGNMVALSRRGLAPRAHGTGHAIPTSLSERPAIETSALVREVRLRSEAIGWRAAVDELRPYTQSMWLAASADQRARFLRHIRPWWEVHRHRLAPAVAEKLDELVGSGRLRILGGRTLGFTATDHDQVCVRWRPRGGGEALDMRVRRVINCSGPRVDLDRTTDRLGRQLRRDRLITADSSQIGLAVDRLAQVIGADGRPSERLFALGPLTRGTFWEITAVPDIRMQTWSLARRLANAHWVAGEGL